MSNVPSTDGNPSTTSITDKAMVNAPPIPATAKTTKEDLKATPSNPEKHGQGILAHVEARRKEFEAKLAATPNDPARDPSHAGAIESALAAVKGLLSGDLTNINPKTAEELSLWLESSKHLSDEKPKASAKA